MASTSPLAPSAAASPGPPSGSGSALEKAALVAGLRAQVEAIERVRSIFLPETVLGGRPAILAEHEREAFTSGWRLGPAEIDGIIGPGGLDPAGVHEIKPATERVGAAAQGAAALAFALRLAGRWLIALAERDRPRCGGGVHAWQSTERRVLFCRTVAGRLELGRLYGPGLSALGLSPRDLLIVEPARVADALWAMEEGLKSQSIAIVIGCVDEVGLNPARRLSLAAAHAGVPCLLVTGARTPPAAATVSRWRVSAAAGRRHPLDAHAPGASCVRARLERWRGGLAGAPEAGFLLEWCDATVRFHMARRLEDCPDAAGAAG